MSYVLNALHKISLPKRADNPIIAELLSNYTYGEKWSVSFDSNANAITLGIFERASLDTSEFVLNITDDGVYIEGENYSALMRGFITLLERIKYDDSKECFYVENECVRKSPLIKFRCAHLCIFPETKLDFFKKCVRSCAVAKYSHVIFEFWGMLKFDCMKELSWPFAYTKEQIREIVREANALGVEIIPMFNHLGHASACREINGKHVVLDQNPKYECLFNSYGWVWNIGRSDVRELHAKIRAELMDICGEGGYFHLGCDEAYSVGHDIGAASEMAEYINSVAEDLKRKDRKAIIWHDLLLSKADCAGYVSSSVKQIADLLTEKLDKNIIIADWDYTAHGEIWKSPKKFTDAGFEVLCCPWEKQQNIEEAVNTVTDGGLYGIIHTTWHTLYAAGFRGLVYSGILAYGTEAKDIDVERRFYCASVARKVMPAHGEYEKCGWSEKMTGPGL